MSIKELITDNIKKDPIKFREAILDFIHGIKDFIIQIEKDPEPYATGEIKIYPSELYIIIQKYAQTIYTYSYKLCIFEPIGECYGCLKESKIIGKQTIKKERKIYMRECANNKEAMKAFEININWSRFDNIKCTFCQNTIKDNNNAIIKYNEFCNKYNIFSYDYITIKNKHNHITEELMKKQFHPKNINKFESWGFY